jgi:hypothetical protein
LFCKVAGFDKEDTIAMKRMLSKIAGDGVLDVAGREMYQSDWWNPMGTIGTGLSSLWGSMVSNPLQIASGHQLTDGQKRFATEGQLAQNEQNYLKSMQGTGKEIQRKYQTQLEFLGSPEEARRVIRQEGGHRALRQLDYVQRMSAKPKPEGDQSTPTTPPPDTMPKPTAQAAATPTVPPLSGQGAPQTPMAPPAAMAAQPQPQAPEAPVAPYVHSESLLPGGSTPAAPASARIPQPMPQKAEPDTPAYEHSETMGKPPGAAAAAAAAGKNTAVPGSGMPTQPKPSQKATAVAPPKPSNPGKGIYVPPELQGELSGKGFSFGARGKITGSPGPGF